MRRTVLFNYLLPRRRSTVDVYEDLIWPEIVYGCIDNRAGHLFYNVGIINIDLSGPGKQYIHVLFLK